MYLYVLRFEFNDIIKMFRRDKYILYKLIGNDFILYELFIFCDVNILDELFEICWKGLKGCEVFYYCLNVVVSNGFLMIGKD